MGGKKEAGRKDTTPLDSRRSTKLSKALCQLLRHSGRKEGLDIGSDGFVLLDDVLAASSVVNLNLSPTLADVEVLVADSDKQRFALREDVKGRMWLRANQGHSIQGIDMNLLCGSPISELQPGEVCCHGTYERHLGNILQDGLKAGGAAGQKFRRDVHFSIASPGDEVISGMRQNCQIAVYIDLPRAAAEGGIRFFRSANHVILSEGIDGLIPAAFIESVWSIKRKVQLYPSPQRGACGSVAVSTGGADILEPAGGAETPAVKADGAAEATASCVKIAEPAREMLDSWDEHAAPSAVVSCQNVVLGTDVHELSRRIEAYRLLLGSGPWSML